MNYYYVNSKKTQVIFKIRNTIICFRKARYYRWWKIDNKEEDILNEVIFADKKLTEKHEDNYWRFSGIYSKRTDHKQYCNHLGKELIRYQLSYRDLGKLFANNPFLRRASNSILSDLCYN